MTATRAGLVLPPLIWMAVLFVLSHQTYLPGPSFVPDKVYHLGAYAVLGVLLLRAVHGGRYPLRPGRTVAAVAVTVLYGALDEYHQSFVADRDASGSDLLADFAGALVAVAFAWTWGRWHRRS